MMLGSCGKSANSNVEEGEIIKIDFSNPLTLIDNMAGFTLCKLKDTTDVFPGVVHSADLGNKFFVLLDGSKAPGVYGYDYDGNQIFYYDKVGQGPEELLSFSDSHIYNDSIFIYDSNGGKIIVIDPMGNYIEKLNAPAYSMYFARDDNGDLYFSNGNSTLRHNGYNITYRNGNDEKEIVPIPDNLKDVTICALHDLINFNDKVYFKTPSAPYLIELDNGKATERYHFDFGEHWPGDDVLKSGEHPYNIMQALKKGDYVIDSRFFEAEKHFCLSFVMADTYYYFIYNKDTGNSKLFTADFGVFDAPLGFDPLGRLVLISRGDAPKLLFCTIDV